MSWLSVKGVAKSNGRVVQLGESVLVNADCIRGAPEHVPDASVDLVVTDPPYGIEGDKLHRHYNRDERFVDDGYVEVDAAEYGAFTKLWVAQAERVLRPGGQIYVVSGYTNLYEVLGALRASSLYEVNHIVWRYAFGVYTTRKFVSSHYHILYWAKPGAPRTFNLEARHALDESAPDGGSLNYRDREDVWTISREYKPGKRKNKNELPKALLKKMIAYSSAPGDVVCDFFMGGGSTGAVAIGMSRRFIGFELSARTFQSRLPDLCTVVPGSIRESARTALPLANRGKAWSESEDWRLHQRLVTLRSQGMRKGAIVAALAREFERGAWGIRKRLKLAPPGSPGSSRGGGANEKS